MGLFNKKQSQVKEEVHELSSTEKSQDLKTNFQSTNDLVSSNEEIIDLDQSSYVNSENYSHDVQYPLESYLYYAILERRKEFQERKSSTVDRLLAKIDVDDSAHEERIPLDAAPPKNNAERVAKMASWWSVFYLITSDILGPSSSPYAFSTLGYGKGTIIFLVFYGAAVYCGMLIWRQFMDLNSEVHPVRTFADLAFRIWGRAGKILVMLMHAIYLILAVSLLILGSAQGLSQIIKDKFCFIALAVFFMLAGILLGQIRTLKLYSILSSGSVYATITLCILTMGGAAHSAPNFSAAFKTNDVVKGPVETKAFIGGGTMEHQLVGVMNIIYAYAGSIMFPEILAEMQRPWDFWKGAFLAQTLIFIAYLFFGVFVYCFQGQFTINPAHQGITIYGLQTACNIISIITGMIAAGLYMHVGLKSMYKNIVVDIFKGPNIDVRNGKYMWAIFAIGYWIVSFIISAAVPQLSNIAAISAAACALQFTYSFPALMTATLQIRKDSLLGDGLFDPKTDRCERSDSWKDFSRWKRGFFKQWHWNTFNIILGLASLSLAGLGLWSSIESIISTFKSAGAPSSFSCSAPV
ncbi:N amino acid transport system protein [Wickerhamomyces ciferrii]|uniref:N amino acid transport system protein n=1 Tax=Wickerhamomyces ciferrii (strain ATCC 14091 / BCRC 22168 / CBS 111 / JCM 3599 / NBRC 0793 / NRRL Y-1031 F-60-10) TaxID=1206466 RepID=K0KAH6_WICCF|nr:N amino acid transport system protein [Wickerhamomyces ciferrii]CCH41980.1 N amino acid transport system protein [Wickerhamomyces ciferrii]